MNALAARLAIPSPVGPLGVTLSPAALLRLDFGGEAGGGAVVPGGESLLAEVRLQLAEYFEGRRRDFDLPTEPQPAGTPFQQAVWEAIRQIPYGEVISYADLAAWAGSPGAVRAAANACGANRIAIVIPCHRVVAKGGLGGFGGGIEIKRTLLDLERKRGPRP